MQTTFLELFRGDKVKRKFNNPYTRMSKEFEEYPMLLDSHDWINASYEFDNLERAKVFHSKKGTTNGTWYHDLMTDSD